MVYCKKCIELNLTNLKPLRSDNQHGYCRNHRLEAPSEKKRRSDYTILTKDKRKEQYNNRTESEKLKFREQNKIASKKYRDNNKEKRKKICASWAKRNPEKARKIAQRAELKRRGTIKGCLDHRISSSMYIALRANKKGRHWESLVDYTVEDLKNHLENLFTEGMTWDLLLKGKIHIDHIKPRSIFKYDSPDDPQFKECWSLSNLQPLWALDNIKKSNKL